MGAVEVSRVTSWSDRRRFLNFPHALYRNDQYWVPRLRMIERELLGYSRHPFHETAEVASFLARRNGEICGRIAAIVNHEHNRAYQEKRGFFGFFETVNDPEVSKAMFDTAVEWLTARGMTAVRGPMNPSMNYDCGMLVDGFDRQPTFLMPYNPDYYPRLVEAYGFTKAQDLYSYMGMREQLPAFEEELGGLVDQAQERCNATVRPINMSKQDFELFLDIYNRSFEAMWGFVPLTPSELREFARTLSYLISPELARIAEVDGRGVGAVLGLPDFNPAIKQIGGKLFPFGFLKLLRARKHSRRLRIISINVVPEFQRWGLGLVLLRSLVPMAMALDTQEAEFSWIAESNMLPRMGMEKAKLRLEKTHRIYDLELTAPAGS